MVSPVDATTTSMPRGRQIRISDNFCQWRQQYRADRPVQRASTEVTVEPYVDA
jgi:hypothetical protein